jgi:tRNA A37 methylthiotransferase MiaB
VEILLDETSKKDETRLRGRTRNNLRVIVDRSDGLRIGSKVEVRVREIAGTSLRGDLVAGARGG